MREVLFRAKTTNEHGNEYRIDENIWVEGFLSPFGRDGCGNIKGYIITTLTPIEVHVNGELREGMSFVIVPETVGQFTGLYDKNGKKVFEGDIIKTHYANVVKADFVELVVFNNGKYCGMSKLEGGGKMYAPLADGVPHVKQDKSIYMDCMEVIGNVHDNPELWEGV